MLQSRLIPCLLVRERGLVKTVQFEAPKYVGDPLNAVRIFNEKEVDELMVLDIDATTEGREPDYQMIMNLASECRMPLCYGGGVRTVEQIQRIVSLGVEKVAIGAAAVQRPALIEEAAGKVGRQSVVVVMDVRRKGLLGGRFQLHIFNGRQATGLDPVDFARKMEGLGAGELVLNNIDRDGTMQGYDLALVESVRAATTLPLTILGGAGSLDDIRSLIARFGCIGAAAGSLFVFKGVYRAVLINYPQRAEKDRVLSAYSGKSIRNQNGYIG